MEEMFTPRDYCDFPLEGHQSMLADVLRVDSFDRALGQVICPGDVVVDIGTGTGILAFLASRHGASRVFAIDRSEIVRLAKRVKRQNFPGAAIEFLQLDVLTDPLPKIRADVIICELLGPFGVGEEILAAVARVRDKLLVSGGRIVPSRVQLWIAPIESPDLHRNLAFWEQPVNGIDFSSFQKAAYDNAYRFTSEPLRFLGESVLLTERDFATTSGAAIRCRCEVKITCSGTLHGMVGYFRAVLDDQVVLTNDPRGVATHWGHVFLPIGSGLSVGDGDRVEFRFSERTTERESRWTWGGQLVQGQAGARVPGASFRQRASTPIWED